MVIILVLLIDTTALQTHFNVFEANVHYYEYGFNPFILAKEFNRRHTLREAYSDPEQTCSYSRGCGNFPTKHPLFPARH